MPWTASPRFLLEAEAPLETMKSLVLSQVIAFMITGKSFDAKAFLERIDLKAFLKGI